MRFFKIFRIFLIVSIHLAAKEKPSIIFYNHQHLSFEHCEKVLKQAKFFNPDTQIYFIDNIQSQSKNLKKIRSIPANFIPVESIRKSPSHKKYLKTSEARFLYREDKNKDPYLKWFVLYDFLHHFSMKNAFFIDMDTLIYFNIEKNYKLFRNFYPNLGLSFENEDYASSSVVYIHEDIALERLVKFIIKESLNFTRPGKLLGNFQKEYGKEVADALPLLPEDYVEEVLFNNQEGMKAREKKEFCKNFSVFNSIFDSIAIGEFLAGVNLELGFKQTGHFNSKSIVNPFHFRFELLKDEQEKKVPYLFYKGQKIKINNLKIESLEVDPFLSY